MKNTKNYMNKVQALFSAMHGDDAMLEAVAQQLDFFPRYVDAVIDYAVKGSMLKESCASFEQRRAELERLDVSRRKAHDAAIAAVGVINRFCDAYHVEHLTDVDTTDRNAVANFVGNFVLEIYMGEINGKGMDEAVQKADGKQYGTIDSVKDHFVD